MKNYTLIERIGAGGFGTVHLAENKKNGKQAVVKEKVIWFHIQEYSVWSTLNKCIRVSGLDQVQRERVVEEFRLLSCLTDISIVR